MTGEPSYLSFKTWLGVIPERVLRHFVRDHVRFDSGRLLTLRLCGSATALGGHVVLSVGVERVSECPR